MNLSNDALRDLTATAELKCDSGMLQYHFELLKGYIIKDHHLSVGSLEGFRLSVQPRRIGGMSDK